MCVIIAITLINHHHHRSGHHYRHHVLDEIETRSQWHSSALHYFSSTKGTRWEKKPLKLLQHCFPASPCSPGFDKSCWMLFLELTSSRFILSDEKSEVNREGRRTWNGFISVKDPLLNRRVHSPHLIEYRLCADRALRKAPVIHLTSSCQARTVDRAPPTPPPLTFTHLSTAGRQSPWWGVT